MVGVSVIMPVFNSELYVEAAIKSIVDQSFTDFELIIVNDGSKDKSGEICEKYSKLDSRIHYYEKANGGICSARNYGLRMAKGKYVAFIDNDDEYSYNLLEDNVKLAKIYDADIVKFQKAKIYIKNGRITSIIKKEFDYDIKFLSDVELIKNFSDVLEYGGTIWNCIYKKSFLDQNNIKFNETIRNVIEDHDFNYSCYKYVNKIVLNSKEYYLWNVRIEHSTTGKFIYERFDNIKDMAENEYRVLESRGVFNENSSYWIRIKEDYLINIILVMNYINSDFNFKSAKEYLKGIKKFEVFGRSGKLQEYIYLFKNSTALRTISIILFDLNLIVLLWLLSRIKMKREIEQGKRRF